MARLFGTDGVRGVANVELTPEMAFLLGRTGCGLMGRGKKRPVFVVGRDPRVSGPLLETALTSGILSTGADVLRVGVMTTPGVAHLARRFGAQGGVVVSASHNPYEYNGIKFFNEVGEKIPEGLEDKVEEMMLLKRDDHPRPGGTSVGRVFEVEDAIDRYVDFLKGTTGVSLEGLRVVVDCANGSASAISPRVFRRLGAEVVAINADPTGENINVDCGSLHPGALSEVVTSQAADAGFAHDGDADRTIAVDERGRVLDGDHIMAVVGLDLLRRDMLPSGTVVATVMSNVGLDVAFRRAGGNVVRARVGDRCVLEEMRKRRAVLGGEQSGHIIFLNHLPTGDGILTAVHVAQVMKSTKRPLSELAEEMVRVPQVVRSVPVYDKGGFSSNSRITLAVAEAEDTLGDSGRVLVRASGTEPVVRIMVEGEDEARVDQLVTMLEEVIREEIG